MIFPTKNKTIMKPVLLISLGVVCAALLFTDARAESTDSPLTQAKAALKTGDLATAETLLTPLTTGEKPDAAAVHQLGLVRQRQQRATDAVALFEQATKLDATKPEYFSALGVAISQRMGDVTFMQQAMLSGKMKKAFAKSIELDPNHLDGLIGLTRFYSNAPEIAGGSLEKAAEFAERVKKINPFLGELELGTVAERREDFAAALTHYDAASQLKPDHANEHVLAGRMLAKLGRKDDARVRFETALKLDPKREAAKKALAALDAPAP